MVTTLFGNNENYRPISRSRTTLLGSWSLWEGADHFVQIEVLGFQETHKRFYFADIRAFTVRPTNRGSWIHLLLGTLTGTTSAVALWWLASGYFSGGVLDWLLLASTAVLAFGWLVHLVLGTTCVCHVVTPVQNARLTALTRVRKARRVIAHLARRAETVQGGKGSERLWHPSPDERGSRLEMGPTAAVAFKTPVTPRPEVRTGEKLEERPRPLHQVVTVFSLLNAAALFSFLIWDSYALRAGQVVLMVGLLALGISCAATSRRAGSAVFRWIGWALFGANGLVFLLWYGYGLYLTSVSKAPGPVLEVNYVAEMLKVSPHTSAYWFWVVLVDACFSAVVGFTGLARLVFGGNRREVTD